VLTVLLGLTGALTYGAADFFGGLAARRSSTLLTTAGVAVVGLIGLLATSLFVPARSSLDAWIIGGASGLAGALGIGLLYGSLAIGPMSILSPTQPSSPPSFPSVWTGARRSGEPVLRGTGCRLVAIILVGFVPEQGAVRPGAIGLGMAVGSGALIGLTIVLIDAAPDDSGLIPLLANRIVSTFSLALAIVVVIGARSLRGTSPRLPGLRTIPSVWIMVVVAGILDVIANVAVLYGLRTGALTVMAVLVALYPAGTIVLAGLWLKERVAAIQWVGLALALIASALLAL